MSTEAATLDTIELQRILTALEPRAYLPAPRLLRRLIKQDREVSGLGLQVPHHRSYVATRDSVLRSLDHAELGLPANHELPPVCILIASPGNRQLASMPPALSLLRLWRTLFHVRIHVELEQRLHGVTPAELQTRIAEIGRAEFDEIRTVLRQDAYLLPPADDREVYIEFAAVYLELRYFARPLLPHYFPGLRQPEVVESLLAADVDAEKLFALTRPPGAADAEAPEEPAGEEPGAEPTADIIDQLEEGPLPGVLEDMLARLRGDSTTGRFRTLIRRAKKSAKRGNHVRAALGRMQASWLAPPERRAEIRAGAFAELDRLTARLQAALNLDVHEAARWRRALRLLLEPAACGFWPTEARLLHDLQKVCLDHEHELYTTDLVDWALSLGRRPIRRPLPCQRLVLRLRHLRTAARRVRGARLDETERARLSGLLRTALRRARNDMRERLRPVLSDSLEAVGMRPANLPERAAASKLTEELLDRVEDQGFLTMGDLRDGISRNNLKLPDLGQEDRPAWIERFGPVARRFLSGAREFFRGDRLLRADRRLASALDGVYHRGEFYLRWLQRLSSLAFGTRTGRLLTLYAALPFGGAFMLLFMCLELRGYGRMLSRLFGWSVRTAPTHAPEHIHIHWPSPVAVVVLGLFFLGLLHWPGFRRLVWQVLLGAGRALGWLVRDLPLWVRRWPPVRWVLESLPVVLFRRYVLKPLVCAGLAGLFLRAVGADLFRSSVLGGATFATTALFFNTRLGRDVEETVTDWLVRGWQRLHFDLIPGLVRIVLAFFKQLLEDVDRFLYRVDEWLRFRSGERPLFQVLKPALGLIWYVVTYVVRFFINVLVEPQINPIKHFPVVTVSHKLVLALFVPPFSGFLMSVFGYDKAKAVATAFTIGLMPPGLFGFLVWEFKENWRLYRANQPEGLRPVAIGHHGETMVRLLRPGLHSGALPKLYARLRKGGRTAYRGGEWRAFRRQRDALHHLEDRLRVFVDREVAFLLNQSPCWGQAPVHAGAVWLGTNRIRLEMCCPELGAAGVVIVFEERAGQLWAGIAEPGWLPQLSTEQASVLAAALAGLYKMAGVDVVSIVLDTPWNGSASANGDASSEPLGIRQVPVSWQAWVATWQARAMDAPQARPLLDGVRLLPELGESVSVRETSRA